MVNALTQRHRAQQLLLRRATQSQVARLWPALSWERLDESYPSFAVSMAKLVETNRRTSTGLAASYVRNVRRAEKVSSRLEIVTAPALIVDQFSASLHTTSVAALKRSAAAGVVKDVALANALTQTQGAMTRLVLNAGRQTITSSAVADPNAGWVRVGNGGCDWCAQFLDGEVHYVEGYDFDAHDDCQCTAELVYE